MTLFVAEIENRDPTDPTDPTAYIDQLASMAQVAMMEEMSVEANTNAVLMSNIQVMALGNMVGDDIMVQTTSLDIEDNSKEIRGRVTLDDSCTDVDLHFTDEAGDDYTVSLIPQGETSVGPGGGFRHQSCGLRHPAGRLQRIRGDQYRRRGSAD